MIAVNLDILTWTSGDKSLADCLQLMSNEGLTSIAVVDNAMNVIGNISTADVKLLTRYVTDAQIIASKILKPKY